MSTIRYRPLTLDAQGKMTVRSALSVPRKAPALQPKMGKAGLPKAYLTRALYEWRGQAPGASAEIRTGLEGVSTGYRT